MYGKSNLETYIPICKIDSQQEFTIWLRELKQGLCINLEGMGWGGRWEGVSKGGDICIPIADSRESNGTSLQYLAWKIPWTEEPGRLWSMGSLRVGHN